MRKVDGQRQREGDEARRRETRRGQRPPACSATSNHRLSRFPPPIADLLPLLPFHHRLPPPPSLLRYPRSIIIYSTDTHERHATCAPEQVRGGREGQK